MFFAFRKHLMIKARANLVLIMASSVVSFLLKLVVV